jgi:hypothetical protein
VEEGVADVVDFGVGLVEGGENDVPEEPAADGEEERYRVRNCLAVRFDESAGVLAGMP